MCFGATRTTRSPAGDQEALEGAGHVPAVLDRPHPLGVELPRPPRQLAEAATARRPISSPRAAAMYPSTTPQACVFLCVSVPITIICTVPSVDDEAHSGGHAHSGPMPSSYQVTPGGPRAAMGDTTSVGDTSRSTERQRVSPPLAREPTDAVGSLAEVSISISADEQEDAFVLIPVTPSRS
jgi:hypothetical protein